MSMTRIGVLHMDEFPEHAVHVLGGYVELYEHLFRDVPVELVHVPVHHGVTPASLDDADVWVIGGSRYSVYDDLEWIRTAEELIRDLVAAERALVGICFGHQLIAQALGGRTARAPSGWGIGARRYDTLRPLPWFAAGDDHMVLLASHQDQVLEPPAEATVWSTADYCPVAGMTIGERVWTMQGHPEFVPPVVEVLYEGRRAVLGDEAVDAARRSLSRPLSNAAIAEAIVAFVRPDR
jgi:GMP synthase-like glutamine amidotransferase